MQEILITKADGSYELIDSGNGQKLERFGDIILSRPDPQAIWQKQKPGLWENANAIYVRKGDEGSWNNGKLPPSWTIEFANLTFSIKPTSFKHTGLFPEQAAQWKWMTEIIEKQENKEISVLNIFAYTGGASIALAKVGARVTHVDASKTAIGWAQENAILNDIHTIRFMFDDALDFVKREIRRGNKYDAILLDPPSFGRGPNGEEWHIEKSLPELISFLPQLLTETPVFILASGYAAGFSPIAYDNLFSNILSINGYRKQFGDLTIEESGENGRLLPCGIYWRTNN